MHIWTSFHKLCSNSQSTMCVRCNHSFKQIFKSRFARNLFCWFWITCNEYQTHENSTSLVIWFHNTWKFNFTCNMIIRTGQRGPAQSWVSGSKTNLSLGRDAVVLWSWTIDAWHCSLVVNQRTMLWISSHESEIHSAVGLWLQCRSLVGNQRATPWISSCELENAVVL